MKELTFSVENPNGAITEIAPENLEIINAKIGTLAAKSPSIEDRIAALESFALDSILEG